MELADVTDSKSVGSNTVRVRPPPSAPKSVTPLIEWGYTFYVLVGGKTRNLRVRHGCLIMNAQSFKQGCLKSAALSCHTMWQPKRLTRQWCETNRAFINVQRMHDGGRAKSAQGRADPNGRNSTPRYTFARSTSGVLFLVRRVREHATCE